MKEPIEVIETHPFAKSAEGIWSDSEKADFITYIAYHPKAGDVIQATGGIRKLRWASSGKGKRGGARVIYFFHDEAGRLFLLAAYEKAGKIDLTAQEKAALKRAVERIKNLEQG